jgi:hypothetical protein
MTPGDHWAIMRRVGALMLLSVAAVGCSSAPRPASQVRPRSTATLSIVEPVPGAVVTSRTLHVRLQLMGATITPVTSSQLSPNKGHIHLILDGRVVSMSYGLEQDVSVTPGDHLLQAEFVAQDHFPFNPRVVKSVTFTVK